MQPRDRVDVDARLLSGFDFRCRPDCGLCCYARPLVTAPERERLLQIEPSTPLEPRRAGIWTIDSRPRGGACHFLHANRCRVHGVRPFPCAQFPVDTHLGTRIQLTLVFSCPGLNVEPLTQWASTSPPTVPPRGLDDELAAVQRELPESGAIDAILDANRERERLRHRLELEGRWADEDEVRRRLRPAIGGPVLERARPAEPPSREESLENLPLFFHPRYGRVAIASHSAGWELLALAEGGGVTDELGVFPVPDRPPRLTPAAKSLLEGYLVYHLERDQFVWELFGRLAAGEAGTVDELALDSLTEAAGDVLWRGSVRAKLEGGAGETLSPGEVADGIRATDAELLDRPTLGSKL